MSRGSKTRKLTCIITGKTLLASIDYYQKKLAKANGDEELLHKYYVCKEAKDLLLKGYSINDIRNSIPSTITTEIPEEIINTIIGAKLKNKIVAKPQIQLHREEEPDVIQFIENLKNETITK